MKEFPRDSDVVTGIATVIVGAIILILLYLIGYWLYGGQDIPSYY